MKCYDYNPNLFRNIVGPDWSLWRAIYKIFGSAVPMIDRTRTIKTPIGVDFPKRLELPLYDDEFSLSYKDCCSLRVLELVELQDKLNVPIQLMYSGGIDSSLILASFFDTIGVVESARRIEILLSQESIYENPWMWTKFIRPHFKILNSENFRNHFTKSSIITAGEGNDQLLGADLYRHIVGWGGDGILNKLYNSDLITGYMFYKGMTPKEVDCWYNLLETVISKSPCPITTVGDWWQWINLTCKWSSVYFRGFRSTPKDSLLDENYLNVFYQQFYCNDNFQKWSMKNRSLKHQGNFITYKFHARDLVASITGIPEYLTKIKRGSFYEIIRITKTYSLLDENYQPHYDFKIEDLYDPKNSFKC
jgi:hypothetical protein